MIVDGNKTKKQLPIHISVHLFLIAIHKRVYRHEVYNSVYSSFGPATFLLLVVLVI